MSVYYPVLLSLSGRRCLVVGGGTVAARKMTGLLEAGATIRLVAPSLTRTVEQAAEAGSIELILASYEERHLEGVSLVFAATDIRSVNAKVVSDSRLHGIPVNCADLQEQGDFIVPATFRRGDLCISVSTGSASPKLAARIRSELDARFGNEYADYVRLLGEMRQYLKGRSCSAEKRDLALERLLDAEQELLGILVETGYAEARDEAIGVVERALE